MILRHCHDDNWSLEFRGGYPRFVQYLAGRRWPYEALMTVPPLLLVGGVAGAAWEVRRRRGSASPPLSLLLSLVLLIPLVFVALGIRVSPTYMPLWYPLPFALMGWAAQRCTQPGAGRGWRRLLTPLLLLVLAGQLAFFADQLHYLATRGGVPDSLLDRSYAGLIADRTALAPKVQAGEVWVEYAGTSPIMNEATAYVFRHAAWTGSAPGRVLIRYQPPWLGPPTIESLPDEAVPSPKAYQVHPWTGRQQRDGRVLREPSSLTTD